ncbi:hypothetical protein RA27_10045 [Ruegeria sp. ANG-R]|uniref:hypothetical protein n=1 Tax=Ruegeria sp. ANG-R TaxID=1577903 RepID=UPI00057EACAF|nr:hypothetical protein [Ruegeria sp. ANG-R]KIC41569.1 hypothetical protein RA27_10045 [Ruegeria sp. ANG-R]
MNSAFRRLISILALLTVISGCAYENRALNAEQAVLANTSGDIINHSVAVGGTFQAPPDTIQSTSLLLARAPIRTAYYALQLSDAYKRLGDEAARNRDLTAAGLITVAGAAALGNAASISGKDLALVLAGGALINEGIKYVNPNSAAQAFYVASESMACASTAIAAHVPQNVPPNIRVTTLTLWYIRKIEVLLRAALKRDVPDWSTLLKNLGLTGHTGGDSVTFVSDGIDIKALEEGLERCLRRNPEEFYKAKK